MSERAFAFAYIDSLKFAGGSFTLMPREALRELIAPAHRHGVLVAWKTVLHRNG